MISSDDNSGIFTFLVGIIILVMAGVGLSILIDRRFQFSSSVGETQREIHAGDSDLYDLRARIEERSREFSESGLRLQNDDKDYKQLSSRLETLRGLGSVLVKNREELQAEVASLDEKFSRYRSNYRRKTWAAAVGEKLGNITIRSGREYREATITRVTEVGLEIHHENGIARIQGPDLDARFQDRFQWNDEDRRQRLKEEHENLKKLDAKPDDSGEPAEDGNELVSNDTVSASRKAAAARKGAAVADAEKLKALRQAVIAWRLKVSKLSSDRNEAMSRASYGNNTSVPGSLETWEARAARIGKDLSRAKAALVIAKSDLGMVAPNDSLLLAPEEQP
ncbi:MAG: hypothetical protein V4584_15130 [Verrucomicrobiota bacterium]